MDNKNNKKESRGMYVSLAICLAAIGIAAWGTFVGVTDYVSENGVSSKPEVSSPLESEVDVTSKNELTETSKINEENPTDDQVNALPYTLNEKFDYPVKSHVELLKFSENELVYNEVMKDYRIHSGTDFPAAVGEEVFSCNGGVVKKVFNDLLLGNVVIIEHGEYNFWYCGLADNIAVKENDVIKTKTKLGTVFDVPFETKTSHLHLEVIKGENHVNPMTLSYN